MTRGKSQNFVHLLCTFRKLLLVIFSLIALHQSSIGQFRYLKIQIDSAYNLSLREADWTVGQDTFPNTAMTSWSAPDPLEVTGDSPNWQRFMLYDNNENTHVYTNNVSSEEHDFYHIILDLGEGNEIIPDSLHMIKANFSVLESFRVYLSNDLIYWDQYLDTSFTEIFFMNIDVPLEFKPDTIPPSITTTLYAKHQKHDKIYLSWEPATDNESVEYYRIYQDGILIDSTKYERYIADTLIENTAYDFQIAAVDRFFNSAPLSNLLNASTVTIDLEAPILNGTINVDSISYDMLCLSWPAATDNVGINNYVIRENGKVIGISNQNEYCLPGLTENTQYDFTVQAKDSNGNLSEIITNQFTTAEQSTDTLILGTNFWNQHWSNQGAQLFTNSFLNVTGDNPWKPELLNELNYSKTLRFMEMQLINQLPSAIWMERQQKVDIIQNELAYEWMIDLCNRTSSNLYVCLPNTIISRNGIADSTENYIQKLALLIKTGIDMLDVDLDQISFDSLHMLSSFDLEMLGGIYRSPPLNSELQVYIEYGNENWNTNFPQEYYCAQEGLAMELDETPWGSRNYFNGYASVVLFDEFERAFNIDNPRIRKIMPIRRANIFWLNLVFENIFESPTYNPNNTFPNHISGATYFGNGLDGADPFIIDSLCMGIDENITEMQGLRDYLDIVGENYNRYFGMTSYEGGHHVVTNYAQLNANPEIYNTYLLYLDAMKSIFEEIDIYNHVSTNAFGLKQSINQDIATAHKYRAVIDWLNGAQPIKTNKWLGGDGFWNQDEMWSLGHVPLLDERVLISNEDPQVIQILDDEYFECLKLRIVSDNTILNIYGELSIIDPD